MLRTRSSQRHDETIMWMTTCRCTVSSVASRSRVTRWRFRLVARRVVAPFSSSLPLERKAQPMASQGYLARVVACGIWRGSRIEVERRGVQLPKLSSSPQFAWLRYAVVARHEDRGATRTVFQLRAPRNMSMPSHHAWPCSPPSS